MYESLISLQVGIGIKLDGENISNAVISTDQGHFSVLSTDTWDLERLDEQVYLDTSNLSAMLVWGFDVFGDFERSRNDLGELLPDNVVITAVVTFEDGEVQEQSITFNPQGIWGDVVASAVAASEATRPEPNPDGTFG